ncbi:MAG: cupin domain-containing protein [Chitinophagaceae bacterium]
METKVFIEDNDIPWEVVGEGVKRKIMAYDDRLMMVKVSFQTGGVGSIHQHHHTQITHIQSGVFEVIISGEKKILKAGDAFFIPTNELHGCVCVEEGVLVDVFSPHREDFLQKG